MNGVLWINDSKATNVSSTLVAVQGMTRPTILLLGGRHKGEPYRALAAPLKKVGKAVIAYGEAAPLVEQDFVDLTSPESVDAFIQIEPDGDRIVCMCTDDRGTWLGIYSKKKLEASQGRVK